MVMSDDEIRIAYGNLCCDDRDAVEHEVSRLKSLKSGSSIRGSATMATFQKAMFNLGFIGPSKSSKADSTPSMGRKETDDLTLRYKELVSLNADLLNENKSLLEQMTAKNHQIVNYLASIADLSEQLENQRFQEVIIQNATEEAAW